MQILSILGQSVPAADRTSQQQFADEAYGTTEVRGSVTVMRGKPVEKDELKKQYRIRQEIGRFLSTQMQKTD
jgi:hypothetical protein